MKTLLIGLDGFDPDLTAKWMEEGKLPNISRIAAEGVFSTLKSLVPPISPAVWTSILTGVNPARHGVFDFTLKAGGRLRLLDGFKREAPNIFEMLSTCGRGVISVGFPATLPLGKIRGAVLCGWDSPFSVKGKKSGCHPAWLHDVLARKFGEDYLPFDVMDQFRMDGGPASESAAQKLALTPLRRASLALYLFGEGLAGPVDLLAVYFPEGDAAGHQFWHRSDPRSPRREKGLEREPLGDPLERVYRSVDSAVGMLEEGFSPDAVIIVSDHGMGGSGTNVISLNRALWEAGFLKLKSDLQGGIFSLLSRLSVEAVKRLPPAVRELAVKGGVRAVSDMSITMMRFGGIDMARTEAFSEDLSYAPSIWLNSGRPGEGNDERERTERIAAALMSESQIAGAISAVYSRQELYRGPFEERIPHILLDLNLDGGYSYNLLPGHFREMKRSIEPVPPRLLTGEKGKSRHGSHRSLGILIMKLSDGCHGCFPAGEMQLCDLAPFILSLHKVGIENYFDTGKKFDFPQKIALTGYGAAGAAVKTLPDYVEMKRRLEYLGYL